MMMMTKAQVYDMAKELRAERVKGRTARYMELLETLYDEDGPTKIFECRQKSSETTLFVLIAMLNQWVKIYKKSSKTP